MMEHLTSNDGYTVWFDGSLTVKSNQIDKYVGIAHAGKLYTDVITDDIKQYNRLTTTPIKIKTSLDDIPNDWIIPESIRSIDVWEYLNSKLDDEIRNNSFSKTEIITRYKRIEYEYDALIDAGHTELIYVILYIINTFEQKNIVWGIGRGSSTSSYLLYLFGIHDIDSVEYELDFSEFLH